MDTTKLYDTELYETRLGIVSEVEKWLKDLNAEACDVDPDEHCYKFSVEIYGNEDVRKDADLLLSENPCFSVVAVESGTDDNGDYTDFVCELDDYYKYGVDEEAINNWHYLWGYEA